MDGARGTYGRQEKCVHGFWWGDVKERGHLEDLNIDERIIIKCIFK
jgi:hypothetical protein